MCPTTFYAQLLFTNSCAACAEVNFVQQQYHGKQYVQNETTRKALILIPFQVIELRKWNFFEDIRYS